MRRSEQQHRITSVLLQADAPLTLDELSTECQIAPDDVEGVLDDLIDRRQVAAAKLIGDKPHPQYRWAARWEQEIREREGRAQHTLAALVAQGRSASPSKPPGIDSDPVLTFYDFVLNQYTPPADKRMLVFLQCSVRRPFCTSPSHGAMRRAILVATGFDPSPRRQMQQCPVHVVVLASTVGPVPYDLQDIYPANVRAGGVKHFGLDDYEHARPILAGRMAGYLIAHGKQYKHIAAFADGRYAQVLADARRASSVDFPIFPDADGPRITRIKERRPYWEKYWIQLYLEITRWLTPAQRRDAEARLKKAGFTYESG
ncbi:MAG: hypothetical protein CMJ49_14660 [Planctomycetaceae bacterium]|nr:hypothetical protein [Planctomycetaceae bacterium]